MTEDYYLERLKPYLSYLIYYPALKGRAIDAFVLYSIAIKGRAIDVLVCFQLLRHLCR
jgi:hypothetical protein